MKKLLLLLSSIFITGLTACTDEQEIGLTTNQKGFTFTAEVPEVTSLSRSMGSTPDESSLTEMQLIVFDETGHFIGRYPAQVSQEETGKYKYVVSNLRASSEKRIIHFIAGHLDDIKLDHTYSEQMVFSQLTVSNPNDAYWQRREYPDGIRENYQEGLVRLVRNFSEIKLKAEDSYTTEDGKTVTVTGFAVVNHLQKGWIGPYNPNQASFVNYEKFDGSTYKDFYKYTDNYTGFPVDDDQIETVTPEAEAFNESPKYVYARNQTESDKPLYLLLKAEADGKHCYYKVDMLGRSEQNITALLNLYNNFSYTVKITKISAVGYAKIEDAMDAAASNNISSSVDVSTVPGISDGKGNSLEVQSLSELITSTEPLRMYFKYEEKGGTTAEGVRIVPYPEPNWDAIQSAEIEGNEIIITPVNPLPDEMQTQVLLLTTPSGLSRRITIGVRKPYDFVASACQAFVEKDIVPAELSCVVSLPENLPLSIFPLELELRPDNKVIYPDAAKNQERIPVGTDWRDFFYKIEVPYNYYRLNKLINCYFLTNEKNASATITVRAKHFNEINTMKFATATEPGFPKYFEDISIENQYGIPFVKGSEVKLTFTLSESPVNNNWISIYTRYLENPTVNNGAEIRKGDKDFSYFLYPKTTDKTYTVTFRTKDDIAAEAIELTSNTLSYVPCVINYSNPAVSLNCTRDEGAFKTGDVIVICIDKNYNNKTAELVIDGSNKLVMKSFSGHKREDKLYFSYTDNSGSSAVFYTAEATVGDLIGGKVKELRFNKK